MQVVPGREVPENVVYEEFMMNMFFSGLLKPYLGLLHFIISQIPSGVGV